MLSTGSMRKAAFTFGLPTCMQNDPVKPQPSDWAADPRLACLMLIGRYSARNVKACLGGNFLKAPILVSLPEAKCSAASLAPLLWPATPMVSVFTSDFSSGCVSSQLFRSWRKGSCMYRSRCDVAYEDGMPDDVRSML